MTKPRRTKADVTNIRDAIRETLSGEYPMTVRQVFYRLVAQGVIAKTEGEYQATVVRLLTEMRRAGDIPFGWIADNTRLMRKPWTCGSLSEMLEMTAETYRRDLWAKADAYVEVWLEKDALSGVLYQVTGKWDVPLMVTRGYPSLSFLYSAAETMADVGKPCYLYYFGDYDPSGLDITRVVERGIREFAPKAEIHFERVAVTPEQIVEMKLPTRPTKTSDKRSRNFYSESVEVDAIPSDTLRELARERIARHLDLWAVKRLVEVEKQERATLRSVAQAIRYGYTVRD